MKNVARIFTGLIAGICLTLMLSAVAMPPNYGSQILMGTDAGGGITNPVSASSPIPVYDATLNINPTYSAGIVDITPASVPTDVFCITGSATKTIYVTRAQFSAGASTSSSIDVVLIKRTTANTGAASAVLAVSHDSQNAAYTASVFNYLTNPSVIGSGRVIRADEVGVALDTNGYPNSPFIWDFGTRSSQPIVLRGTAESFCVNLNGVAMPPGMAAYSDVEWFEK